MVPLFIASLALLALGRRVDITVTTLKSASLEALESIRVVAFDAVGDRVPTMVADTDEAAVVD